MKKIALMTLLVGLLTACTPAQIMHYFTPVGVEATDGDANEVPPDFTSVEVQIAAQNWWCDGGWASVTLDEAVELLGYGPTPICDVYGLRVPPGWTLEMRPGPCNGHETGTATTDDGSTGVVCVNTGRPHLAWRGTLAHELTHAWGLFIGRHPSILQEYEQVANCGMLMAGFSEVVRTPTYYTSVPMYLRCPGPGTWQWDLAADLYELAA